MQFAKLPPVMDAVQSELGLDLIGAGFAVSILGLVGILCAISTGAIVAAIGLRRSLVFAMLSGAIFAAMGAAAPTAWLFLCSRLLEGFSHLVLVVCAPALMSQHAVERDKPIVLALWGCFFGLGFSILSASAPFIIHIGGWRGLMLGHAGLLLAIAGLIAFALARSGSRDTPHAFPTLKMLIDAHVSVYTSGAPLLLALTFGAYTILFLANLTFLGRYLGEIRGWNHDSVGRFLSLVTLVCLVATLTAGALVRAGVPLFAGLACAFGGLALCAIGIFAAPVSDTQLIVLIIGMMAMFGLLPGFVFANVPLIAPTPDRAALTYGAIAQFGNVGTFLGTPLFAIAYKSAGWTGGALFVSLAALVGIGLASRLRYTS